MLLILKHTSIVTYTCSLFIIKIKKVLQGVSSWFESYVSLMEDSVSCVNGNRPEPELYKAMLLLLARIFDYNLRTEDLLELTSGNRQVALESVVGILEDGEVGGYIYI